MAKVVVEASNLGKSYVSRGTAVPTLFGAMRNVIKGEKQPVFWAVRGLNFKVKKGVSLGIIGPNGSGKSSTLGLTVGTIAPTEGSVKTEGLISAMLELGAGFHGDLTGRENVYLNATLMGIPREDIAKKMDSIADFAELGDHFDLPVKTYSSGMYVRLGFAVATEVDPDILVVDEVMAVGDMLFQEKSMTRMREFQQKGKTILFCSHDMGMVHAFCDEVMLIDSGELVDVGEPDYMIGQYHDMVRPDLAAENRRREEERKKREKIEAEQRKKKLQKMKEKEGNPLIFQHEHGNRDIEFTQVYFTGSDGQVVESPLYGELLTIVMEYESKKGIDNPVFGIRIKEKSGQVVFGTNTQIEDLSIERVEVGRGVVRVTFDPLPLNEGTYFLSVATHSDDHHVHYHRMEDWIKFSVLQGSGPEGIVIIPLKWEQETLT